MRIENSFVPVRGVGEKTERRLWREGITHWDDFEPSSVGDVQGENITDYIDRARDRLAAGDAAFFDRAFPSGSRWRLYENFRGNACFFDIETTGLDARHNDVTTVSFHRAGETTTLVRGDDLTQEAIRRELDAADLLVSFNGKRFDVPFLERSFELDITQPHLDVMYPCRQLDLTGGLKAIEEEIGIERDRPDISGRDAVRLWHAYGRGDEDALDTLVAYNRADTANLKSLLDTVTRRLHESVFVGDTERR
ncbi:ribonuclease H-like domain-containing protein [Halococcus qingdaonensis]|uniref:ribonuclease H-like domain-containing protein n=1 Tax=Halococcus qingdaonensis TaxID=224402 RepID=UPI002116167F|nr:ribonuclease H-like domain-containing protein [Halococcus qingdaonensis]